jgi:hypothetical protein
MRSVVEQLADEAILGTLRYPYSVLNVTAKELKSKN